MAFKDNNEVIMAGMQSGSVKIISKSTKEILNEIKGCFNIQSFMSIVGISNEPVIYCVAKDSSGFKIADIDSD